MWLDEVDLHAVRGVSWALQQAAGLLDLRRTALDEVSRLVPADVTSWNELEHGVEEVGHEAVPAGAEPAGAFRHVAPTALQHPLLHPHAVRPRPAVRLSDAVGPRRLQRSELYGELLHRSGAEYGISIGVCARARDMVVLALGRHERDFSERDRDVLNLTRPALEQALQDAQARRRLVAAQSTEAPPGAAVVVLDRYGEIERASGEAQRWLVEHFGAAEHPSWLPAAVAAWLSLPPRPPLVSVREGRRLTVRLLPGEPHVLLLEEDVASFRSDALSRLGLTARERELLDAARATPAQDDLADELFLSRHAVWERAERVEEKLGVQTLGEAIAAALRASV